MRKSRLLPAKLKNNLISHKLIDFICVVAHLMISDRRACELEMLCDLSSCYSRQEAPAGFRRCSFLSTNGVFEDGAYPERGLSHRFILHRFLCLKVHPFASFTLPRVKGAKAGKGYLFALCELLLDAC